MGSSFFFWTYLEKYGTIYLRLELRKMKKIVYQKDIDKMPNRDRGNILLKEGWHLKRLYSEAETDREQNAYFCMMRIFMQMAAYDFGFNNEYDMYSYLDDKGEDEV